MINGQLVCVSLLLGLSGDTLCYWYPTKGNLYSKTVMFENENERQHYWFVSR